MLLRSSQASPLKSQAERLIESIQKAVSVDDIKMIMSVLNQIKAVNPTLANQLMLKLMTAIRLSLNTLMANANVPQLKHWLDCLKFCSQNMPELDTPLQDILNNVETWLETQDHPGSRVKQVYQSASVYYAVMHDTEAVKPTKQTPERHAPVPAKPVMLGGIFIEPYWGLVPE